MSNYHEMMNSTYQIERNQNQVNELHGVMRQNMNDLMDRDLNLDNLNRNADDLNYQANAFQTTSNKAKKRFACKNYKWTLIICITVLVIILVIVAIIVGVVLSRN